MLSEEYVDANPGSVLRPIRSSLVIGSCIFLVFFAFSLCFSATFRTFYQDDNVVFLAPLMIDAARQILNGSIPYHTFYVGGGGGTPLISILQAGVLNPLGMLAALVLNSRPELMINVLTCLHLSLFAAGGWFMACCLRAPTWAGLCAAFSLGFSGYYWAMGGYWMAALMPYAFLPWVVGSLVVLWSSDQLRHVIMIEIVLAVSFICLLVSGAPNAAFYSAPVVFCFVCALVLEDRHGLKRLALRLIPQGLLFFAVVVPLLWESRKVYEFYGRVVSAQAWSYFAVPLHAYLGLFFPGTYSVWTLNLGSRVLMTDILLSAGAVPAWFILARIFQKPDIFLDRRVLPLAAGAVLSPLILSPHALGVDGIMSGLPIINAFRFPFRAIPALHVLLAGLFLVLVTKMRFPDRFVFKCVLVTACLGFGGLGLMHELSVSKELTAEQSWFNLMASSRYNDPQCWSDTSMQQLRSGGYLLSLCRSHGAYNAKPRIYFHGNLGAQYEVRSVGNYVLAAQCRARAELGMTNVGRCKDWQRVKVFLERSPARPLLEKVYWENGIGPESFEELASKTYASAVVVERGWLEPKEFFLKSPQWKLLEANGAAFLFVRQARSK